MRLRERDKRKVTIWQPDGMDDDVYRWKEPQEVCVAIYPLSSATDARVYGERVSDMRLFLYDGQINLQVGMGVCVDADDTCDYRIVSVQRWAHARAVLEFIPEGRRE